MDELLSFMEDDFGEESSEPTPSASKCPTSSSPLKHHNSMSAKSAISTAVNKSIKKDKAKLTFNDVFGSPDKRDVNELGLSASSSTSSLKSSKGLNLDRKSTLSLTSSSYSSERYSSSSLSSQLQLSRAIKLDMNVPYKPDTTSVALDPYSRVRILTNSITIYFDESMTAEAVLKDRNIGLEFVNLSTFNGWYRSKGKDTKNFWISGVLVKKTAGVRKSAKGNDYCIWEISDLRDLDKKFTIFLFGSASSSSLSATPVGSLVDITSPSVMQDSSNNGAIKFSISNATQVRFIATSKDFGFCQAIRKDGNKCTVVVNTWECSFCIHHASGELKKLNIGTRKSSKGQKGKAQNGLFPNRSFTDGIESLESLKQQGVMISNFGGGGSLNKSFGQNAAAASSRTSAPSSSRMALQGSSVEMKKNTMKQGNHETIKFITNEREQHRLLKDEPVSRLPLRKPLDLNPSKTRHLTDRDRELLQRLEAKPKPNLTKDKIKQIEDNTLTTPNKNDNPAQSESGTVSNIIASAIIANPNAATRNFMQFLQLQHAPKNQVDLTSHNKSTDLQPIVMSREKVKSMQQALAFVKKNGPIKKIDPNAVIGRKRKFQQMSQGEDGCGSQASSSSQQSSKRRSSSTKIDVEFDFESDEFKKILNAKSAHDEELDTIQHEEYFGKLEKKEALENKLLNTYSIETNAVMCRQCKYVALSQSEFCKNLMHEARIVKARKRFFKCKDCGNRAMSLDRLPKRPCSNCNSSNWLVAPVGKERKGPTLPSEMLAVRGNEEKFVGSAASKMYLHLDVN